ncbi:unnamed protein product [Adineta ricciae]|uniref:DNL-type domain-containing protein n=1 Tax=Adineta ricciae TaxID=249248 RepID=A0A814NG63_ADIRI|nr:unnamed protein product [Adineta ricciae]CAF1258506.1 unnamed protein product [Adineta ricciae]
MFRLALTRLVSTTRISVQSSKVLINYSRCFLRNHSSELNDIKHQPTKIPLASIHQGEASKRMGIQFRCKVCNHTLQKTFTRQSYEHGVVIIRCDSCSNLHLIADNLGWFKDITQNGKFKNIAQMLQAKGETIHRITAVPTDDQSSTLEEKTTTDKMSTAVCTRLNEIHIEFVLNDHDTFLFDCDGVLWCAPIVLPGAIELLNLLTQLGKRVLFVTNNSLKTQRGFSQWLNEIGYPAKPEQVISTAWITAKYLKSINYKGHCYCIGMQSMVEELSREGFHISDGIGPDPVSPETDWIETNTIKFDDQINCVISAFDIHVNYLKIIKAATYLSRPDVLFIATNDDVTTPQNDVAILPAASGRSPTILGKPRAPMFDSIRLAFPDVKPNRTIMIGDRLETDILFGNRQGLTTLLVFSGATSEKKLDMVKQSAEKTANDRDLLPKYCIKDVQHLLELIITQTKPSS